jgi:hypothetical protein
MSSSRVISLVWLRNVEYLHLIVNCYSTRNFSSIFIYIFRSRRVTSRLWMSRVTACQKMKMPKFFFLFRGVELGETGCLVRRPLFDLLYQPMIIDDNEGGEVCGMKIGRGDWIIRRISASVQLCPWSRLGLNPGRQSGKTASNRLSNVAVLIRTKKTKLHGLCPRANYTDQATAACRRSDCQLLRTEGATWSEWRIPTAVFSIF